MSVSLLPSNSGAFERAASLVSAGRRPLPAWLISEVKDPDRCPAELLPALAAEYSVDVWDEDWTESRKRSVVRNAIHHHRMKGTLAGISAYAGLVDAEVLSAIRPPQKFFASSSTTLVERIAWLEALPKIKIYRYHDRQPARPAIFAGGSLKPMFLEGRYVIPSNAPDNSGPRALIIRDGVEVEIGIETDNEGIRTVLFRRSAGLRSFAGKMVKRFLIPSTASSAVAKITYDTTIDPQFANPLRPAGTGSVLPHFSSDPKIMGRRWYAGALAWRRYLGAPDSQLRVFEQIPLADDLAPAEPRKSVSFVSHTRLSVPAHTAELKVSIPGKATKHHLFLGSRFAGQFLAPVGKERLGKAFKAMRAAKRASDKVLIDTRTYRPLQAGSPIFAGQTYLAGQMTRS